MLASLAIGLSARGVAQSPPGRTSTRSTRSHSRPRPSRRGSRVRRDVEYRMLVGRQGGRLRPAARTRPASPASTTPASARWASTTSRATSSATARINALTPEALVYEPRPNGGCARRRSSTSCSRTPGTPPTTGRRRCSARTSCYAGRQPLRPAAVLLAARLDLEAQPARRVRHVEPERPLPGGLRPHRRPEAVAPRPPVIAALTRRSCAWYQAGGNALGWADDRRHLEPREPLPPGAGRWPRDGGGVRREAGGAAPRDRRPAARRARGPGGRQPRRARGPAHAARRRVAQRAPTHPDPRGIRVGFLSRLS